MSIKSHLKKVLSNFLGVETLANLSRWRRYPKFYKSERFSRGSIDKKLENLLPHRNGFYVELEVLKGTDFQRFKFKHIVLESRNIELIKIFLSNHFYELVEKITLQDYLFYQKNTQNLIK